MDLIVDHNDFSDDILNWDIYKIFNYIKVHYIQFLLLILVGVIIYVVDHISNINAIIFAMPSPMQGVSASQKQILPESKNKTSKKPKGSKK